MCRAVRSKVLDELTGLKCDPDLQQPGYARWVGDWRTLDRCAEALLPALVGERCRRHRCLFDDLSFSTYGRLCHIVYPALELYWDVLSVQFC
eukprot:92420-Pyramimonas_sp.AAC.1